MKIANGRLATVATLATSRLRRTAVHSLALSSIHSSKANSVARNQRGCARTVKPCFSNKSLAFGVCMNERSAAAFGLRASEVIATG